jgi:hypothetical protein
MFRIRIRLKADPDPVGGISDTDPDLGFTITLEVKI